MTNRLFALTFDCADAAELGGFWADAVGQELHPGAGKEWRPPPPGGKTPAGPSRGGPFAQVPGATRRGIGYTRA